MKENKSQSSLLLVKNGVQYYSSVTKARCVPAYARILSWKVTNLVSGKPQIYVEVEYFADEKGEKLLTMPDGAHGRTINLIDAEVEKLSLPYLQGFISEI